MKKFKPIETEPASTELREINTAKLSSIREKIDRLIAKPTFVSNADYLQLKQQLPSGFFLKSTVLKGREAYKVFFSEAIMHGFFSLIDQFFQSYKGSLFVTDNTITETDLREFLELAYRQRQLACFDRLMGNISQLLSNYDFYCLVNPSSLLGLALKDYSDSNEPPAKTAIADFIQLMKYYNVDITLPIHDGKTLLDQAVDLARKNNNDLTLLSSLLLGHPNASAEDLLFTAIKLPGNRGFSLVIYLVDNHRVDVNIRDAIGIPLLYYLFYPDLKTSETILFSATSEKNYVLSIPAYDINKLSLSPCMTIPLEDFSNTLTFILLKGADLQQVVNGKPLIQLGKEHTNPFIRSIIERCREIYVNYKLSQHSVSTTPNNPGKTRDHSRSDPGKRLQLF